MISFGGGVNSVAMTIMMVGDGWRGPIVFADTGGEWPETYCYMRYFEQEFLRPHGLEITRVSPATDEGLYDDKRIGGTTGVASLEDYCLKRGIIPLLAVRWCTVEFKHTPLDNWRIKRGIDHSCIAFTVDEGHRKQRDGFRYPLLEASVTRQECYRIIRRAGLDYPVPSRCFFCPGQNLASWRRLHHKHPQLYERAIALEDNASANDQKWATLDPNGVSLRQHRKRRWQGEIEMDLSAWLPCVCQL